MSTNLTFSNRHIYHDSRSHMHQELRRNSPNVPAETSPRDYGGARDTATSPGATRAPAADEIHGAKDIEI